MRALSIPPSTVEFPVSLPQRDLWIAHQLSPSAYNEAIVHEVTGEFDEESWQRALESLVAKKLALIETYTRELRELACAADLSPASATEMLDALIAAVEPSSINVWGSSNPAARSFAVNSAGE